MSDHDHPAAEPPAAPAGDRDRSDEIRKVDDFDVELERVELDVHVDAPPEVVFDYVADPERFPGVDGAVTLGEVLEREAPHRIRWHAATRTADGDAGALVEVTLRPDGDGTTVRVVQWPLGAPARARLGSPRPTARWATLRAVRRASLGRSARVPPTCRAQARRNLLERRRNAITNR